MMVAVYALLRVMLLNLLFNKKTVSFKYRARPILQYEPTLSKELYYRGALISTLNMEAQADMDDKSCAIQERERVSWYDDIHMHEGHI